LDLRADLLSFRSKVLPLVETVTALLQQMEGDLPKAERVHEPRPKIATYEEMYGPITHTPSPEPTQPPVDPPPRRRWPWSS
jgi:hypothetical protein